MKHEIYCEGTSLSKIKFINISEFFFESRESWVNASQLNDPHFNRGNSHYLNSLINNLSQPGKVKKIVDLHDKEQQQIIKFSFILKEGEEEKTILTKGYWREGFTKHSNLISFDEEGREVEFNYTKFTHFFVHGEFKPFHKKYFPEDLFIKRINFIGIIKHFGELFDGFSIDYGIPFGKKGEAYSSLLLGRLNSAVYHHE